MIFFSIIHLETALVDDDIDYHERGHAYREAGPSISISVSSTSILDLFTSYGNFGVDPFISATYLFLELDELGWCRLVHKRSRLIHELG
jgi:hypothetical protein